MSKIVSAAAPAAAASAAAGGDDNDGTVSEAGARLISVRPSDVLSKYQGESERYISSLFAQAQAHEPHAGTAPATTPPRVIIFFDGAVVIVTVTVM